ncbi:nucleoside hydrolase [uncultured Pseudokineococcus sp.]|uniref:nucleoside hydrolase n=1 Tax=uncultured Pseudokineococcus sp. TaxID=1642928 RepID=UPI00260B91B5|nr:nucleoside hydrolase [uncultured Pseudokineococcus sp.]
MDDVDEPRPLFPLEPAGAEEPLPVVVDCDPGVDDAVALLLALAAPELDVRAVTTTAGNASLDVVTANAARVLDLAGARADLRLARGAAGPLGRARRERTPTSTASAPSAGSTSRRRPGRSPTRRPSTSSPAPSRSGPVRSCSWRSAR